jgi:pimeloyl-ACP methyl ester carboxylesterase
MAMIDNAVFRLAAETFGSPGHPALVLIMGATASMLAWPEALCRKLADPGLFVVRFDHRDTGESTTGPPAPPAYAVEDMAGDVFRVLDDQGLQCAHLMGMSLGGYIGQICALTAPERVRSLTLYASEPLGWDGSPLPHMSFALVSHFGGLSGLDWSDRPAVEAFLLGIDRLCASPQHPFDTGGARDRIARVLCRTGSPASMFNHAALSLREDWSGRYRDLAVPVLVLHGADDPVLPVQNGRAIAAGVSGARLTVLPALGHELPPRVHDAIAELVADFVRQNDSEESDDAG